MSTAPLTPDTRTCIIGQAKKLFGLRDFESVSMADIAEACGLQKPSLYHFFKSKEDIYLAMVANVIDSTLQALRYDLTYVNRRLAGDQATGRKEMARLIAKFIRVAEREGTVIRQVDLDLLKNNPDYRRVHRSIGDLRDAFLTFFIKHGVQEPTLALEVCTNSIRAYILNRRLGLQCRVTPGRYANYLAGLLIK